MRLFIEAPGAVGGQFIDITPEAVKRARLDFNPSGRDDVARLKLLAAAFYSELERVAQNGVDPSDTTRQHEAITAATHIQAGAMFAVSAATAS